MGNYSVFHFYQTRLSNRERLRTGSYLSDKKIRQANVHQRPMSWLVCKLKVMVLNQQNIDEKESLLPHRMHSEHKIDGVAWSVCLSVGHVREPCKNGRTDQDAD